MTMTHGATHSLVSSHAVDRCVFLGAVQVSDMTPYKVLFEIEKLVVSITESILKVSTRIWREWE